MKDNKKNANDNALLQNANMELSDEDTAKVVGGSAFDTFTKKDSVFGKNGAVLKPIAHDNASK